MPYINPVSPKPVHLELAKSDVAKYIRKGHPWVYRDAFREPLPAAAPGSLALVKDAKREILAKGIYDGSSPLAFRVCALRESLDDELIQRRLTAALALRRRLFAGNDTNCFRLLNGEGEAWSCSLRWW